MNDSADVVVVGMGPGGEEAAGRLAEAGLDVIGIDHRLLGGECPYWGCVPSKMMIRAANALAESRRVADLAGSSSAEPDWAPVSRRIREEATDNWDDKVAVERFEGKGGRFRRGTARLIGPDRVAVDGDEISARRALILATGTEPSVPPIAGLDDVAYWTNRQAIEAEEVPRSLVVVGGGAIGLELGQVFSRFGSQVSVVEGADRLLPLEEPESSRVIEEVLGGEGVAVHTAASVERVRRDGDGVSVELGGGQVVRGERLLIATGRRANLAALGVEHIGLDASARSIPVDDHLRAAPGVWALGDVTGVGPFTHVSMYQAAIVVDDVLGRPVDGADYRALPRVTFTDPEVGSVGLTEQAARDRGITVRASVSPLPSSARGWIHKTGNQGLIKLVEDADAGVLVGATSVGPMGGEVLGLLTLAVHERTPVARLAAMIYAYPTFHRAIEDAVRRLRSPS